MELPYSFIDFLADIRPTKAQRDDLKQGHTTLRTRLEDDEGLGALIVDTFLQGSYRRWTAIRPRGDKRSDVDVIVVTRLHESEYTPDQALQLFIPFLEKHYAGKYRLQGRSIGIEMSKVDLDLVITSAPSEQEEGVLQMNAVTADLLEEIGSGTPIDAELSKYVRVSGSGALLIASAKSQPEWKLSPLRIPDRDAQIWEDTHPLAQIVWTRQKNAACGGHYVNVVKALKWWRRVNHATPKHPKGYPVEHIIGYSCPDGIKSIAEGVTLTLENIAATFAVTAAAQQTPDLRDHGVSEHNVFSRISGTDFAAFHAQVVEAAKISRKALDAKDEAESTQLWKQLFGDKFPDAPATSTKSSGGGSASSTGGFTPRTNETTPVAGRFA